MTEPKQYRALDIDPTPDPFTGKRRAREGYYFKLDGPSYAFNEGQGDEDKHYLVRSSFADWNMTKEPELYEIDITTLEEL